MNMSPTIMKPSTSSHLRGMGIDLSVPPEYMNFIELDLICAYANIKTEPRGYGHDPLVAAP